MMSTDLEELLSAALHREAAELVPDESVPAPPARNRAGRTGRTAASRWWAPTVAAAAVLVVAGTAVVVVQTHRGTGPVPAAAGPRASTGPGSALPGPSCGDGRSGHTARTGGFVIGVTDTLFCLSYGNGQTVGTSLKSSGAMRGMLSTDSVVAGVVDGSVDRVLWLPGARGWSADETDASSAPVDLAVLGTLRGFAFPFGDGGLLVLYSGSGVVDTYAVTNPTAATAAASSMAATMQQAMPSYPAGQGPTAPDGLWPTNAKGQTYGTATDANGQIFEPDLIAAVATNGEEGYVLRTDLEGPQPTSPSDAISMNDAPSRTIPVYTSDGTTQIGVFVIGAAPGGSDQPVTSSSAAATN